MHIIGNMPNKLIEQRLSETPEQQATTLLGHRQAGVPVWIRPPARGGCHWCGLTRSVLYRLAAERRIRTVNLRDPGKLRGIRLFHLGSILDMIAAAEGRGQKGDI